MTAGAVRGEDGLLRCPWGDSPADYRAYHDGEWGRPVRGDAAIFERLSLEAFQCGLSWLTVLRRRQGLRAAFAGFDIETVASFDDDAVDRLVADPRVIRHRAKIESVISNARTLRDWRGCEGDGVLDALVWGFAHDRPAPRTGADVPASTEGSSLLARLLRARGWRFIGPTTAYAALQAMGVVDDHLVDCHARPSG